MGFRYRRTLDGDSIAGAKDFPLDATYAATAKPGDVVRLNGTGNLVLAVTGDTTVLGGLDGVNFNGLGVTPTIGKVILDPEAVYEADTIGAGALIAGTAYGIDGASNVDTADITVLIVKIVEVVRGKAHVIITARQLF